MDGALMSVAVSAGVLFILTVLYVVEDVQGRRIMLSGAREFLDSIFSVIANSLLNIFRSVWRFSAQFVLKHGVYALLGSLVSYLKGLEKRVEERVLYYRKHRTHEKVSRTHLDEIAEHKEHTSLSEEERRRLRDE